MSRMGIEEDGLISCVGKGGFSRRACCESKTEITCFPL